MCLRKRSISFLFIVVQGEREGKEEEGLVEGVDGRGKEMKLFLKSCLRMLRENRKNRYSSKECCSVRKASNILKNTSDPLPVLLSSSF